MCQPECSKPSKASQIPLNVGKYLNFWGILETSCHRPELVLFHANQELLEINHHDFLGNIACNVVPDVYLTGFGLILSIGVVAGGILQHLWWFNPCCYINMEQDVGLRSIKNIHPIISTLSQITHNAGMMPK